MRITAASTVGQLTSSIAHEINQPLMSIVSNAGASLRWLNRDPARLDKVREGLEEIAAEGGVSENTVKLHRRRIMEKMQVRSVAELVRAVERLTKHQPVE
ncbi:hypothetical protein AWI19_24490 [Enterobacter hormaechei subsp. xiangfangensis]|nr:hypothetical protein AWI19_24490 [Enterobacter hormaechei subsp. xiangfangensis]